MSENWQEVIFTDQRRKKKFSIPDKIPLLQRVQTIKILGVTFTSSLSVKAATDEPGYPAGLHGRAAGRVNRVSFVIPGQPSRATRLVCRGTRTAQIFRQKSIALQCFFVARPGKSARVSRHPCSPAEHTTLFSF